MSYLEMGEPADLLRRINYAADLLGGVEFGDFALDVGGRNGFYVPVIRGLGVGRVAIVDPAAEEVQYAIDEGVVARDDAFGCKIHEYVASGHPQADTAFALNMQPRLSGDREFLTGLTGAVRTGGWIVASAMEPVTAMTFRTCMERGFGEEWEYAASAPASDSLPLLHTGPNCYVQLWKRAA
jgi:hypothetical protein